MLNQRMAYVNGAQWMQEREKSNVSIPLVDFMKIEEALRMTASLTDVIKASALAKSFLPSPPKD